MSTKEILSSAFISMNGSENLPHVGKIVSLPIVDFVKLRQNSITRSMEVQNIGRACKKFGCFRVLNHGIQESVISGALEAASEFFKLPAEEKEQLESDDVKKPVRYCERANGNNNNARALLKLYAHPLNEWIQLWPQAPSSYREKMGRYSLEVRKVALELIDAILESLGLGQGYMNEKLDEGMQTTVINCYSKHSKPGLVVGLSPHSDYACITVLLQNCAGLQIFDKDTGSWKEVPGDKSILHVHIGDHIEVLSNGKYKTVVHKAVLSNRQRISIASLHGLSMDEKVATARELVDEQHPKRYKESSFRDFLDYITNKSTTSGKSFMETLRLNGS